MGSEVRSRARLFAVLAACIVTAAASSALAAEPSLSDRETARSLMEDGDAKRDKGDIKAALKSYEGADAIMHVPTTGLEVGRAQAALGLLLEARETLNRVERLPAKPNEPAPFAAARTTAAELSSQLAQRIPTIVVTVKNADPAQPPEIIIDGEKIPAAAADAPRKLNPGAHSVIVRAGGVDKEQKVLVAEREQKVVSVDLKAPAVVEATPPDDGQPKKSALPKILIFGGFGLAAVGIGVGSVTGLMSISQTNDIKPSCNPNCPTSKQSDIDSARSLGNISTVAFIVGGAGAAAGVIGLVLNHKQETTSTAGITPVVGPTWAGLTGRF
jgi:hypothetical protein